MIPIQYDFFSTEEESEFHALEKSIEDIKKSTERVRKGTYAEIGALKKRVLELEERLQIIERNICK